VPFGSGSSRFESSGVDGWFSVRMLPEEPTPLFAFNDFPVPSGRMPLNGPFSSWAGFGWRCRYASARRGASAVSRTLAKDGNTSASAPEKASKTARSADRDRALEMFARAYYPGRSGQVDRARSGAVSGEGWLG
jgi:hypothetical protein